MDNAKTLKLPNFHTYTTNKPKLPGTKSGGGTTILIHRKFIHHKVDILTNSIENTTIQVNMGNEEVRLAVVYKKIPTILDTTDIEKILDSRLSTIIAGDLNTKHTTWNSSLNNPAGNTITLYKQ